MTLEELKKLVCEATGQEHFDVACLCLSQGRLRPTIDEEVLMMVKDAEVLEGMANLNAGGGPTYWTGVKENTAGAIMSGDYKTPPGASVRFSPTMIHAIHFVAPRLFDPIWRAAASLIRNNAAARRRELEAKRKEIDDALASLPEIQKTESPNA